MEVRVGDKSSNSHVGLKSMRAGGSRKSDEPDYSCDNCGCKRFNPCGCMRAKEDGANNGPK